MRYALALLGMLSFSEDLRATPECALPGGGAKHAVSSDAEFISYLEAMAWVESSFRPDALSSAGASGLLQLTPPGIAAACEECQQVPPSQVQLVVLGQNIRLASCLLRRYKREAGGNWVGALILYHGGYKQLLRWQKTGRMHASTEHYVVRVLWRKEECKN
jgi:soluble lytic murein transglycosylase-like protein